MVESIIALCTNTSYIGFPVHNRLRDNSPPAMIRSIIPLLPIPIHHTNPFQTPALPLRINPPNPNPAKRTHSRINRKRNASAHSLQHGQKGRSDHQVRRPIRRRRQSGAQTPHSEGKQLSLLPGHAAETERVGEHVEEEGCQECGRSQISGTRGGTRGIDAVEGEGAAEKAEDHEGDAEEEDAAAADSVDEGEGEEGGEEVCKGDRERG